MSNPNIQVFKYHGPLTPEYYNQFFNPNICHVCKSVDNGNMILCDQCCLISYCSEKHRTMHHQYHAKICTIIAQVLQVRPQEDMRQFNRQQWNKSRKILMESIQRKLDDKMELYMQQMIMWSKSCYVCHQQAKLRVCQRCFSANYCDEHVDDFERKHNERDCDELMLLLNIDIKTISGNTTNISYGFLPFVKETSHSEEMLEFCMEYILRRRKNYVHWIAKDYVRSDYLSGPLTVYSGCQRSGSFCVLQEEYVVIHIIAASSVENDGLSAWEILLHLIPQIRKLIIVMVGSELTDYFGEYNLCRRCSDKAKKFSYVSIPMLYNDFIRSSKKYTIPNMILIFHADFNKIDMYGKVIREIADQGRPLILSASCKYEAVYNSLKIEEILGKELMPDLIDKNYFSGLAPHKNLETGDTYFCNEYLVIYNHLYDEISEESN